MRIGSAFPSKYLRAADIPEGKTASVVVDHVAIEDVAGNNDPDERKPVLYFQGKSKGMVLNKTNSNTISQAYGDETDEWAGQPLVLYASETTFNSNVVPCLRVKIPKQPAPRQAPQTLAAAATQNARAKATVPVSNPIDEDTQFKDDDIPF